MTKLALSAALLISTAAVAEEAKPPPPPPEVAKTVGALAGKWAEQCTMTLPGQKPAKLKVTVAACKKIAAGGAVECSFGGTAPGMGVIEETDLIGYDPETKAVHIMTWNNVGEVHDHSLQWKDDKTIAGIHKATSGGKPLEENIEMSFPTPSQFLYKFVSTQEGQATVFDCTASRK